MGKSVFEKVVADDLVVAYVPRKFPLVVSESAKSFVSMRSSGSGTDKFQAGKFQIDRILSEQTGIASLERISLEEKVEQEALVRLQEIQESAYKEAHALGLEEGRKRAYGDAERVIAERLEALDSLLATVARLKTDLVVNNEGHLVRLAHAIGTKLAMNEIAARPDIVAGILRQAIEEGQADERLTVRLSREDMDFVEAARERLGRDTEAVKRIKLERDDTVRTGGCVIETNYGSIDASIEQRVGKLWEAVEEKLPRTSDTAGAADSIGSQEPGSDPSGDPAGDPVSDR